MGGGRGVLALAGECQMPSYKRPPPTQVILYWELSEGYLSGRGGAGCRHWSGGGKPALLTSTLVFLVGETIFQKKKCEMLRHKTLPSSLRAASSIPWLMTRQEGVNVMRGRSEQESFIQDQNHRTKGP